MGKKFFLTLLILGLNGFLLTQLSLVKADSELSYLQIDYGTTEVTKPLDHFAKHKFKVKNTSQESKAFAFSIFMGDSQNSQVGWPQPQMFFLDAGEERYIQTFLESAKLSVEPTDYGTQERTLRWQWQDLNSQQRREDKITYKIKVLKNEEISGDLKISGKVVNASGQGLSGYEVKLSTGTSGWFTTSESGQDGSFSFAGVPVRNDWFLIARAKSGTNQSPTSGSTVCDPPPAPCNPSGEVKGATDSQGVAYAAVNPAVTDYTLKLTPPTISANYEVFKEEKTAIGFWKGAVDKNEKYLLLVNGMENWSDPGLKSKSKLYLYDFDGKQKWSYEMGQEAWGADLSQDGQYAAFATSNQTQNFGVIKTENGQALWVKSSEEWREPQGMKVDSKEVRLSPNNQYLALGAGSGNIFLLKLENGEKIWDQNLKGQVRALVFSNNSEFLYAASGDGNAYKLKTADGSLVWKQDIGSWAFGDQAFKLSKDEQYLGSASKAGEITVIKTENGQKLWQDDQVGASTWMDFSPHGKYMVAGGGGQGATTLYEVADGKKLWRIESFTHQGMFSSDGKFLVLGDQNLKIVDLAGNEVSQINSSSGNVGQGQFAYLTKDGSKIVYSRRDVTPDSITIIFAKGQVGSLVTKSEKETVASEAPTTDEETVTAEEKSSEPITEITIPQKASQLKKWLLWAGLPSMGVLLIIGLVVLAKKKGWQWWKK